MKKNISLILILFALTVKAQLVSIPDANFKSRLVNDWTINTNHDAEIQVSEALAITDSLVVSWSNIGDLTGVEAFTNITSLNCAYNHIDSLNLSVLTAIVSLNCTSNNLYNLDVHANTNLTWLQCNTNHISNLDVSLNTNLVNLSCASNLLTSLNVASNTALMALNFYNNSLSSINLASNTSLIYLNSSSNPLTTLNVTANTALQKLDCSSNQLTSLNLANNTALTHLSCGQNNLSSGLNLTSNILLTNLSCPYTFLQNLNITANTALSWLNCFGNSLYSLNISSNTALFFLDCSQNYSLSALNTSTNTLLNRLICNYTSIDSLNLTNNGALTELQCANSQLVYLNISSNTLLNHLDCTANLLSNINVSANTALTYLSCNHNPILSLDASANGALTEFYCSYTTLHQLKIQNGHNAILTQFYALQNPNLYCIQVDNMTYMNTHFANNIDTFTVFATNCSGIEPIMGYSYSDSNQNCDFDTSDYPLRNLHFKLFDNNNVLLHQLYSQSNGFYRFNVQGGSYKVTLDTAGMPFNLQCGHPGVDTTLITSFNDTTDFSVVCNGQQDFGVHSISTMGWIFPGEQHTLLVNAGDISQWYNLHCSSGIGGSVVITVNGPVSYNGPAVGALIPAVAGNVFTFSISDFGAITNSSAFNLLFTTDTTATDSEFVCISVSINPIAATEHNIDNNTMTYCYRVLNSFDPNTKAVYPLEVKAGYSDFFTYQINFQNTGSAQAFTIKVIDTLAANFDLSTFELLFYSHPCSVTLNGNIITAKFLNINLPDSASNEAASHGYFQYRIKPLANQNLGTEIKNTAFIYFDFNPAVATNTTVNHFSVVTSIEETLQNEISVFPNPNEGLFTVSSNSAKDKKIKLYSILGDMIYETQVQKDKSVVIDLSAQAKGVYVLRVEDESRGVLIGKIIKE